MLQDDMMAALSASECRPVLSQEVPGWWPGVVCEDVGFEGPALKEPGL